MTHDVNGLVEHCVSDFHGTYVMEDTDSMAIVATENGGFVPCPGGRSRCQTATLSRGRCPGNK